MEEKQGLKFKTAQLQYAEFLESLEGMPVLEQERAVVEFMKLKGLSSEKGFGYIFKKPDY